MQSGKGERDESGPRGLRRKTRESSRLRISEKQRGRRSTAAQAGYSIGYTLLLLGYATFLAVFFYHVVACALLFVLPLYLSLLLHVSPVTLPLFVYLKAGRVLLEKNARKTTASCLLFLELEHFLNVEA